MHKYAQKLSEKLAKFSATSHGYSMVKIALLNDAFSEFFKLEAHPVEVQPLQEKEKEKERRKKFKSQKSQRCSACM